MLLGLRTAIYRIPDLAEGKRWYTKVLGFAPYFDEPFYVGYNVGGYELGLLPDAMQPTVGNRHPPVLSHLLSPATWLPRRPAAIGLLCPGQHGWRSAAHASQHGSHPGCVDSLRTSQRARLRLCLHRRGLGLPRPFVPSRHRLLPALRSPAIRLHLLLWAMCRFLPQPSLDSGANL